MAYASHHSPAKETASCAGAYAQLQTRSVSRSIRACRKKSPSGSGGRAVADIPDGRTARVPAAYQRRCYAPDRRCGVQPLPEGEQTPYPSAALARERTEPPVAVGVPFPFGGAAAAVGRAARPCARTLVPAALRLVDASLHCLRWFLPGLRHRWSAACGSNRHAKLPRFDPAFAVASGQAGTFAL